MGDTPPLTIVIPTHDRAASLRRTLDALARQDCDPGLFEIVVVADGCTDGTHALVETFTMAPRLRLLAREGAGPSAARNAGAARAAGEILVFLDDDIEVDRGFVSSHASRHLSEDKRPLVVIGYCPPRVVPTRGLYSAELMNWWEGMFDAMEQPARRFRYSDLLSGNFSLRKSLFNAVGGFDDRLRCHEDYELGFRLIQAGAVFAFERRAWGHHYDISDFERSLARKRDEGKADVELARIHPQLLAGLPLSRATGSFRFFRAMARTRSRAP